MRALADCKWKVKIIEDGRKIKWEAETEDESFIEALESDYELFRSVDMAKGDFMDFAGFNGITNYEFVEG